MVYILHKFILIVFLPLPHRQRFNYKGIFAQMQGFYTI